MYCLLKIEKRTLYLNLYFYIIKIKFKNKINFDYCIQSYMAANFILFLILHKIIKNKRRTQYSNLKGGGGCRKLTHVHVIKVGYANRPRVALWSCCGVGKFLRSSRTLQILFYVTAIIN